MTQQLTRLQEPDTPGAPGAIEPASAAHTPYAWFSDPAVYALEQQRIYQGPTWSFLGLAAEIPKPGDFKATFVGDIPVVVTRTKDGSVAAWVNKCAHRGAQVCRENRGNAAKFTCVYHQWSYDSAGKLRGVPFKRGLAGNAGMPAEFDLSKHNLRTLRVATYHGLIFATFDHEMPGLADYLGPEMTPWIDRLFKDRELVYLGCSRQYSQSNWKLYLENVKDPYHASLLHLFHTTFNIFRATMKVRATADARTGLHSLFTSTRAESESDASEYKRQDIRSYNDQMSLKAPEILRMREEFGEPVTNHIQAIFPSLVIQQIHNTLACRQLLPKGPDSFELVFHYFGYADDDEELRAMRLQQANMVGPAGYISMEDTEATELVQRAVRHAGEETSTMFMGTEDPAGVSSSISERLIRQFWSAYRTLMWPAA